MHLLFQKTVEFAWKETSRLIEEECIGGLWVKQAVTAADGVKEIRVPSCVAFTRKCQMLVSSSDDLLEGTFF